MNENIFVSLRNTLANLYPNEKDIRRIAFDSGINLMHIVFRSSPINSWHDVLIEAGKTNQVDALLGVVKEHYGANDEFRKAHDAYYREIREIHHTDSGLDELINRQKIQNNQSPQFTDTVPCSPTKIIRQCLEEAFDSESIRVFCQDHFGSVFKRLRVVDGLDQVVIEIIRYSEQHNKFDYLWEKIRIERYPAYKRYFSLWQKQNFRSGQ